MAEPNFASGTVWTGDNLDIMRGMNSECVDLIYLDPPFNSNRNYEAPIGTKAAGAAFKDAWTLDDIDVHEHGELADRNPAAYSVIEAARHAHGKGMQSYLIFMAVRLLEMHRILKPTGSIYLHCDPTASHYLKLLMDGIFGRRGFRNEIVWDYTSRLMDLPKFFNRKHDALLFYAKTPNNKFTMPKMAWGREEIKRRHKKKIYLDPEGDEAIWMHQGKDQNKAKLRKLSEIIAEGKALSDVWSMPILTSSAKERTGYPTQKPIALLDRIIRASSNPDDLILDPFCGCATALVAADRLQREWAGIDLSPLAIKLVNERIAEDRAATKEAKYAPVIGGSLFRVTALTEPPAGRT